MKEEKRTMKDKSRTLKLQSPRTPRPVPRASRHRPPSSVLRPPSVPRTSRLVLALLFVALAPVSAAPPLPYQNPNLPTARRVKDLISRMTLAEKVSQMTNSAPAIPRLGIPQYDWWNEALHGVARAGVATVFPQAIGLAATWNPVLMGQTATAISDEARAKNNEALRRNDHSIYHGLTFWSPNINIFRDPRWGRGQETYGEDPYLTSRLAVAFVKGMQGNNPRYLKTVSTLKHFAVHSGPEPERHRFDARISDRDLFDTYLVAFRAGIIHGKAQSVMGAYNAVDGIPACANTRLLTNILRHEWGFGGYVVSDCGAITDIHGGHHYVKTAEQAAALAVKAGCDLSCGRDYLALTQAVHDGLITEKQIDASVTRLFTARFRLGMFDPPAMVPYRQIPASVNDSAAHRALARKDAREAIVLLKNKGGLLPLPKTFKTVAVIGPNADSEDVLLGNYNGTPSKFVTPLSGIRNKLGAAHVVYAKGCDLTQSDPALLSSAVDAARTADLSIVVLGLSPRLEGEEMNVQIPGFRGGDRTSLDLPQSQQDLLKAVVGAGKPVVLALLNGGAVSINWASQHVPAIVEAWYPGEEGGSALADILFGDANPAGCLPVTFYHSVDQLPPFDDYAMAGRTYRYFSGPTLYPFGYGLSYSRFHYSALKISPRVPRPGQSVHISVTVQNVGARDGDAVAELYLTHLHSPVPVPIRSLAGVQRVTLKRGARQRLSFIIDPRQLSIFTNDDRRIEDPGAFDLSVGGGQPGQNIPMTSNILTTRFRVSGPAVHLAP